MIARNIKILLCAIVHKSVKRKCNIKYYNIIILTHLKNNLAIKYQIIIILILQSH